LTLFDLEEISVYHNRGLDRKGVNLEKVPDDGHKSDVVSEDEISYSFEDDDTPVMKKKPRNSQQPKIAKRVPEQSKRCFASLVPNNIRLIYLRRTLVVSLLSQPDTFEQKVVGCFVRCKIAYRVQFYKDSTKAFMLGRVTGKGQLQAFLLILMV